MCRLSAFLYTHILFLVFAIMSLLLGFVLSQMLSRNPRTQRRVVRCVCIIYAYAIM